MCIITKLGLETAAKNTYEKYLPINVCLTLYFGPADLCQEIGEYEMQFLIRMDSCPISLISNMKRLNIIKRK